MVSTMGKNVCWTKFWAGFMNEFVRAKKIKIVKPSAMDGGSRCEHFDDQVRNISKML